MNSSDNMANPDPDQWPAGVVLTGGQSKRFGQDKGRFPYKGKALVEHALDTLRPHCSHLLLSTNKTESYAWLKIPCIPDIYPGCGPLAGIHSALVHAATGTVAILGCDTPHVNGMLFDFLRNKLGKHHAVIPAHGNFAETLCALYSRESLPVLESAIRAGRLKILDALKDLDVLYVNIEKESFYRPGMFHNINRRTDL